MLTIINTEAQQTCWTQNRHEMCHLDPAQPCGFGVWVTTIETTERLLPLKCPLRSQAFTNIPNISNTIAIYI